LENLRTMRFAGSVYAVNPKYDQVEGVPCYPSASALPEVVDSIVVSIPADSVADVLEDAYSAGTRAAVILTSGFGESGRDDRSRIARLRDLADRGMLICGPNCYGILNLKTGAATFNGSVSKDMISGPVGLISQSGGFSNLISEPLMTERRIGFSFLISCGNQLGLTVEDYIQYLIDDSETQVIAAYVEQFRQPWRLPELAVRAAKRGKPIIVHKSGQSEAGRAAVLSHTGSLAGPSVILNALLRRYGYIVVSEIDQLIETISLFATLDRHRRTTTSREVFVVIGGGGEAAHASDAAESVGLGLAPLSPESKSAIAGMMPEFGAAQNPVDGTGAMFEDRQFFPKLMRILLRDPHQGVIAVNVSARARSGQVGVAPSFLRANTSDFINDLAEVGGTTEKVIIAYSSSEIGSSDPAIVEQLKAAGVPYVGGTWRAMRAIADLVAYEANSPDLANEVPRTGARGQLTGKAGEVVLPFSAARDLLNQWGVSVLPTEIAKSAKEAARLAGALGFPVVLKAEMPGLVHKSDVGGVVMGCKDAHEVEAAYAHIVANLHRHDLAVTDVLVQATSKHRFEVLAGVTVDPDIGPAVVFGLGGLFTELIGDTVTEVVPLDLKRARKMVSGIRASRVLSGARGRAPLDVEGIASTLVCLSELAVANRDRLVAIDINPLFVGPVGEGVLAGDVKVVMRGV
jgi:acetyltransferase